MQIKTIASLVLAAGLLLSACGASSPGSDAASTAAAMTVQAALNQVPLASPTASAGEATPAFSDPLASVEDPTNCRAGPGTNYQPITQLQPATQYTIVGFYSAGYWIVTTNEGECWVLGDLVTPVGSYDSVPTVSDAPTLAVSGNAGAPVFAKGSGWIYTCNPNDNTAVVTLNWIDNSDNEAGYKVLRNNTVVAELPSNTTTFSETISLLAGQSVGYQIQAYGPDGDLFSSVASMSC